MKTARMMAVVALIVGSVLALHSGAGRSSRESNAPISNGTI